MTNAFLMVSGFFLKLFGFALCLLALVFVPFLFMCFIRYVHYKRAGMRPKQRKTLSTYHKANLLKRLFWDFPDRFIKDNMEKDPDAFPLNGLVMIVGEQGSGKSCAAVHLMLTLKQQYPRVKILSNMPLTFADEEIKSPDDLVFNSNGSDGCIKFLDEIHNWFNSNESGSFPVEMIGEISQQRKQYSLFIGTAQRFTRISKAIREQTHYILMPMTFAGCLTIVRVYKPNINDDGQVLNMKRIKVYFFVHTDEIRNAYDTLAKIKRLSIKGWKPRTEQLPDENNAPALKLDIQTNEQVTRKRK